MDALRSSPGGYGQPPEITAMDAPRLRDEVRALEHAIRRMKAKPRYEEAALALLEARRRDLASQLAAIEELVWDR